jgi:hypothetical protein
VRNILFFLISVLIFTGCESGKYKSVTGDYFNRKPGTMKTSSIPADSITVVKAFKNIIGTNAYTLAGTYENTSAFSVYKFSRPGQAILDSLLQAKLVLTIGNSWDEGNFEFSLYSTNSSWADSSTIKPSDFLNALGSPISTSSDTASTVSYMYFPIEPQELKSWVSNRSFLVKSSVAGNSMLNIYSDDSSKQPYIQFISKNGNDQDTTVVKSIEGNYYFNIDTTANKPIISDALDSGFVLKIPLPALPGPIVTVNQAILRLKLGEHVITSTNMPVTLYKLTSEFVSTDSITIDTTNSIDVVLKPDQSIYEVNISKYLHSWYNLKTANYGFLVRSSSVSTYPNYAVLEPTDSLRVIYTTLPEVDLK